MPMDSFLIYLVVVNVAAFLAFTVDCFVYGKSGEGVFDGRLLTLFALFGGGVGMMAAFLAWDRKVVKANIAWRFEAVLGIALWTAISLVVYGVVEIDIDGLLGPLGLERLVPLAVYLAIANVATFCLFAYDKRQAEKGGWRVREFALLAASLAGGALGGLAAVHVFRHKTRVWYFTIGLPAMVIAQAALVVYLCAAGIL